MVLLIWINFTLTLLLNIKTAWQFAYMNEFIYTNRIPTIVYRFYSAIHGIYSGFCDFIHIHVGTMTILTMHYANKLIHICKLWWHLI